MEFETKTEERTVNVTHIPNGGTVKTDILIDFLADILENGVAEHKEKYDWVTEILMTISIIKYDEDQELWRLPDVYKKKMAEVYLELELQRIREAVDEMFVMEEEKEEQEKEMVENKFENLCVDIPKSYGR